MGDATSTSGEGAVSFDSVLAAGKPAIKRTRICLRGDLIDTIESLERDLEVARYHDDNENRPPKAPAIAAEIVRLVEEAREHEVEFVFQAIGRRPWRDLAAAHPPTEEQKALGADINIETFPAAAMAASCIAPTGATLEKFEALRDGDLIGDTQWNRLWFTCRETNAGGAEVPLPEAAFALARGTAANSEPRGTTASREASS